MDDVQQQQDTRLQELQEEALSLGMPEDDVKKFTDPTQLVATINVLKATKASMTTDATMLDNTSNIAEDKQIEKQWKTKAEKMAALLDTQPEVRILVPLEGQEKQGVVDVKINPKTGLKEYFHIDGAVQPVTLNGYTVLVPKGVYVSVAEQVAKTIEDKYKQTADAGKQWLIDRKDPETGRQVRDQL